jgi:glycine oxidase
MHFSTHPDVAIVGGGVIGLTTAYYLAREHAAVVVLDQGEFGRESSWAGAGIIPAGNPKRAKSALGQLRGRAVALYPELSAELQVLTGIDNGYVRCGGLELRRSEEALEKQRIEILVRQERGEGAHCEVLDARQLRELEPALSPQLPGAVFFPDMAQVRNPRHVKALVAACSALGVQLWPGHPVLAWRTDGDRITGVQHSAGLLCAERYLIAAGAWSDSLLAALGLSCGVHPVRGQIVLLNVAPPVYRRILLAGAEYIVPRTDGRVLIGSTEEDVGFDKRTTAEAIQGLLSWAIRVAPELGKAPVERCWAGLRPGSADGRPILGPVPGFTNLFVATGHFRSGIQLSPSTGVVMKELLLGQPTSLPMEAFRFDRPPPSVSAAAAEV